MASSTLNIKLKDKVTKIDTVRKTRLTDINYMAKKLKFKYTGYMCRGNANKWNVMATNWTPRNLKRKKRAPNYQVTK